MRGSHSRGGFGDVGGDFFAGGRDVLFVVLVGLFVDFLIRLDVEGLAQLGAVAVEGVGLEAQGPGEVVGGFDVFDGGFVGEVDGL